MLKDRKQYEAALADRIASLLLSDNDALYDVIYSGRNGLEEYSDEELVEYGIDVWDLKPEDV